MVADCDSKEERMVAKLEGFDQQVHDRTYQLLCRAPKDHERGEHKL